MLHVSYADDVRPVLKCFGEERVRYAQNDRRPRERKNNPTKHTNIKYKICVSRVKQKFVKFLKKKAIIKMTMKF